jgi:hypothetical protein
VCETCSRRARSMAAPRRAKYALRLMHDNVRCPCMAVKRNVICPAVT